VRVVGLADGSGCAEDPDGLPMAELLRLVDASLPLAAMDRATLSPRGTVALADTAEGAALRNTMASRVVADAFVPAGGRPASINASNWQAFMCSDGRTPSAKVVVEGANLYFTPDARARLFEACGLPIVKDSSANKCGVVCSSLEIVSSMVLSADEFVAIKPQYVSEVLDRLRELATLEARMLFAERSLDPSRPLPQISEEISVACLRVTTALASHLARFDHTSSRHRLWPLVREQLPPSLFEAHAAKLPARLPWQYQKAMIASGLASRLVYREGLRFVSSISDERLSAFALAYLQQEQRVRHLAKLVRTSDLANREEVEALLLQGGVRVAAEQACAPTLPSAP